jgi:isoquinoline 1-oxidoreductase alpha subunit
MAASALLQRKSNPTDQDIDNSMTNICRCGTYQRIREAVHLAATIAKNPNKRKA